MAISRAKHQIEVTKNIIQNKQEEQDISFTHLLETLDISGEEERDALFDYCYNDFKSPLVNELLER